MSFKLPYGNQTNWGALVLVGPPAGPTVIGQAFGGGFYAGQVSYTATGVADYYLIVAPKSTGQTGPVGFGNTAGVTTSEIDGFANSNLLNSPSNPPAYFCRGLTIGGYNDWYMPARYELEILYYYLKPTTQNNVTYTFRDSGTNRYAVPPRTGPYGLQNPSRTTASDFQSPNAQAFDASAYQASTNEAPSSDFIYRMLFTNADLNFASGGSYRVRAIRRVPV